MAGNNSRNLSPSKGKLSTAHLPYDTQDSDEEQHAQPRLTERDQSDEILTLQANFQALQHAQVKHASDAQQMKSSL